MTSPLDDLPENRRLAMFDSLARTALAYWGLESWDIRCIAHRENAVYEVRSDDGRRLALRVHRYGYQTTESLESEFVWMRALLDRADVITAMPVPALSGQLTVEVSAPGVPVAHLCDVLQWVDGKPLGIVVDPGAEMDEQAVFDRYVTVGEIAARIHRLSATWDLPKGFARPHWDREGCLGTRALWGQWSDITTLTQAQREKLNKAVRLVDEAIGEIGYGRDVYGMVHADFVPDNLYERRDGRIVVLDLDDAGFGWYLWELVTTVFWYLGTPNYSVALRGYLEGYRTVRPLHEEELKWLPHFLLMRALVYLGWMHTRSSQRTAKLLTARIVEVSCLLADRIIAGDLEYKSIPMELSPLPTDV